MPSLSEIKNTIVACVLAFAVGFAVGFAAGFYVESRFVKANQVDTIVAARHETAENIQESSKVSRALDAAIDESNASVQKVRTIIQTRIVKEKTNEKQKTDLGACNDILDIGTISLLNSARRGTALDAPSIGNAESQAPAGTTLPELLDNDLEIVQLYRELAKEHDTLVDYVESIVTKQANQ